MKKSIFLRLVIIVFIVSTAIAGYSQKTTSIGITTSDTIFSLIHVTYPSVALEKGLQGTVFVSLDIDSTCTISNIIITNSLCKDCDVILTKDIKKEESYLQKETNFNCASRKVKFSLDYKLQ